MGNFFKRAGQELAYLINRVMVYTVILILFGWWPMLFGVGAWYNGLASEYHRYGGYLFTVATIAWAVMLLCLSPMFQWEWRHRKDHRKLYDSAKGRVLPGRNPDFDGDALLSDEASSGLSALNQTFNPVRCDCGLTSGQHSIGLRCNICGTYSTMVDLS